MKKVNHLPACLPAALGFQDDSSSPSALPQQRRDRRVTERGCGKSGPWVLAPAGHWAPQERPGRSRGLSVPHFAYPPTSQAQRHQRSGPSQSVLQVVSSLFSLLSPSAGALYRAPLPPSGALWCCPAPLFDIIFIHPCLSSVTLTLSANRDALSSVSCAL